MPSPKLKIPKKLGTCADLLYELQCKRSELTKQANEIKAQETELKKHIIATLPKSELQGVSGNLAKVKVVVDDVVTVEDEEAFRKYLQKSRKWGLAQKLKPCAPLIKEMAEDGKKVPGIGSFQIVKVSCTKV